MDISSALKEGYNHAVTLNIQQKGSKLSDCVRQEIQSQQRYFYDQIAPTEAIDIDVRHSDTPLISTPFDRRMVQLITSDWGDLIDKEDQLKFLYDPSSAYALNAAYALGRRVDVRIIEAAFGKASTGSKGETLIDLPQSQIINNNYNDALASQDPTGLTIEKLRLAREILDDADVDDDEEQYCVVTSKQISDLLRTTEVTSDDYNTVKALVSGKVNTFMGFKFIRISSKILPNVKRSGADKKTDRAILCFAKSGILLAKTGEIRTDISVRTDKRMATQVYASISSGAVRMDEKKVVKLLCAE